MQVHLQNSTSVHLLTISPSIPLRLYSLPYWSNPLFLIFEIRALWRSAKKLKNGARVRPVWRWILRTEQFGTAGVEWVKIIRSTLCPVRVWWPSSTERQCLFSHAVKAVTSTGPSRSNQTQSNAWIHQTLAGVFAIQWFQFSTSFEFASVQCLVSYFLKVTCYSYKLL